MKNIYSQYLNKSYKIAVISTRWNELITEKLLNGSLDALNKKGISEEDITIIKVDGAFEIPITCKALAQSGNYQGIVALGCVIRGETPHFDFVAGECSRGIMSIMLETAIPIGFGLLTTENTEQALARSGGNMGNKGFEATETMLNMISILKQIKE